MRGADIKPVERKEAPKAPPTIRVPASTYPTGGTYIPPTPYSAGAQAGIVKTPERKPIVKEEKPDQEPQGPAWEELMDRSAKELERQHSATISRRNAMQEQIGAVEREHAGPNSAYGASAGRYKPREENPVSSASAAASGGWVSPTDRELSSLRGEAGREQTAVNDLAAAHYYRKNLEQFARLETDTASKTCYASAKEITAELDAIDKALNAPTTYNDQDIRFRDAGDALLRKYGVGDLFALRQTLRSKRAKLVKELTAQGYDFEDMAQYDQMPDMRENYFKSQEVWEEAAEMVPVSSSAFSVAFSPLRSVDAVRTRGNGIGHSNADDLDSYRPMNVYDMYATNMVRSVRSTVSRKVEQSIPWKVFGENVAAFIYNTGMGLADSAFQKAVFGDKAAMLLMGLSSSASTTKEVIERGGSNEQACWLGLAAGATELVFQSFDVDDLLDIKRAKDWEGAVKTALIRTGVPVSKGMLKEVSNILFDTMVMRNRSKLAETARRYGNQGLSQNEAWLQATLDSLAQVGWAGVEGIASVD